ncbi:BREX system ATP-binding domain-containing protein [Amycolatopsis silviterrae]|uniref:BREX system ATP-binding domain-containing protein n=1 Tax=Amycolatopsis silviterrae TaxID=1656914 RepID=A0ABW5H2Y8_9PSEU
MNHTEQFRARTAVECLRAGVPNAVAVELLGTGQPRIGTAFDQLLRQVDDGGTAAMSVGGGFGAGKSHLLTGLRDVALRTGHVVSTVVVSKETPLWDPVKVAKTALTSASARTRRGPVLEELAAGLDPEGQRYRDLLGWAESGESSLDARFPASLRLHAEASARGEDTAGAIERFWSGDQLPATELNRGLRAHGLGRTRFERVPPAELARQRLRFAHRLMTLSGYQGWVVLFDEVELVGRYSPLQRFRAYSEIGRWHLGLDRMTSIGSVWAITEDFGAAVLDGKGDRAELARRVKEQGREAASQAATGMAALDRDVLLLDRPDGTALGRAYRRIRDLHGLAYDWTPPDVPGLPSGSTHQFRQHVRGWINEWDLVRLDPGYRPRTVLNDLW